MPATPEITSPEIADEPEQPGTPIPRQDLTIGWDRVRKIVDGEPVKITGYQVIVTKEVPDDPHGFSRPAYDVHVPARVNALSVPAEFLEPNTVYELEVLALAERQPDHQRRLLQNQYNADPASRVPTRDP